MRRIQVPSQENKITRAVISPKSTRADDVVFPVVTAGFQFVSGDDFKFVSGDDFELVGG